MKVHVDKISPSPSGLVLGLRIEHEKAGWVRFSTTVLVTSNLSRAERQWILESLAEQRDDVLDYVDEPLSFD